MRFLIGLALVVTAILIWRVIGRRPPVLRTLGNGDRVLGPPSTARAPRFGADAVEIRRIARDPAPSSRLADVEPGTWLELSRDDDQWVLTDDEGPIAHVGRAGVGPDTPSDALTLATGNLPATGRVWVDRVLQDAEGRTIDLRGVALPHRD